MRFLICSVLVACAAAVSNGVMRREDASSRTLTLNSNGELVDVRTDPDVPNSPCDKEYPLGKEGTSECMLPHHDVIVDLQNCMSAARASNAGVEKKSDGGSAMSVSEDWWDHHPRGCFAWPCETGPSKMCYFYNPVGSDPCKLRVGGANCTGTPVCFAAHYVHGNASSNTPHGSTCPTGYQEVLDKNKCMAAASCLGERTLGLGNPFSIAMVNSTLHDEHPEGCFIDEQDATRMHWNEPNANYSRPGTAPSAYIGKPKGIPLCNATEAGHMWPNRDSKGAGEETLHDHHGVDAATTPEAAAKEKCGVSAFNSDALCAAAPTHLATLTKYIAANADKECAGAKCEQADCCEA